MDSSDKLLDQAITQDLFGPEGLTEPAEIEVPEKYELQECLGKGGFGTVYKAHDRILDRTVALKFLTGARPADVQRFKREARFAARLDDPAIVQVYEFGECSGQPYIAMQYVDGGHLDRSRVTRPQLLIAVRQVSAALSRAHALGIVHRDIKPANILMTSDGRALLTDFGLARELTWGAATMSQSEIVAGTPAMMPPEQARGEAYAIDARADVYSLGATLYVLLCGRYPFEADNVVDVLHAVLHDEPPLPRAFDATIPRGLEAIIVKCMQKERACRYASVTELIDDLDAHLDGREVRSESSEWFRKLVGAPAPTPQNDEDLFPTIGVDTLRGIAGWDAELYRVSRNISRLFPKLDSTIERMSDLLERYPNLAWARFYRGMASHRRGQLVEALDDMERSIDRMDDQAGCQFEMGQLYLTLYLRAHDRAHKHLTPLGVEQNLADCRGLLNQAVVAFNEAKRLTGDLPRWRLDFSKAVGHLGDHNHEGCIEVCDRILAEDPDIEDVWRLRGDALRFSDRDPIASYDEALRIRRSDYQACLSKAEVYIHRVEFDAAMDSLSAALEIYPELAEARALFARVCLLRAGTQQNPDDASRFMRDGLTHAEQALGFEPRNYEAVLTCAELCLAIARLDGDLEATNKALQVLRPADTLPGCQNRVQQTRASAHLQRAELLKRSGHDPRSDLDEVLSFDDGRGHLDKNETWQLLFNSARRELEELE
jgi:serine/threonine protein kinase